MVYCYSGGCESGWRVLGTAACCRSEGKELGDDEMIRKWRERVI